MVLIENENSMKGAANCDGLNKRTLPVTRREKLHRLLLDARTVGEKWAKADRRKQKDALYEAVVVTAVVNWWTSETRKSPNKDDLTSQLIYDNNREYHPCHFLEENQICFLSCMLLQNDR